MRRVLAVIVALAMVGTACSKDASGDGGSATPGIQDVKIAFIGDLSGPNDQLVASSYHAAQLAFSEFNAAQRAVRVVLVGEDSRGDPVEAAAIARNIAADPTFEGVVGPAFSDESESAGGVLDAARLPFITPSATGDTLATNGWGYWFRAIGNDSGEASAAALYIENVLKPRCAFIADDGSAYGRGLAGLVARSLTADGAKATSEASVAPTSDYRAFVTEIKSSRCKVLFYGGYVAEASKIREQMNAAGLRGVLMLGGDGIQANDMVTGSGSASGAEGTVAVVPSLLITQSPDAAARRFVSAYEARFGQEPAIYAGEGWDIAQMYIAALKAGKTDHQSIADFFHALIDFPGLAKYYTFLADGELVPASVVDYIYQVRNGTWAMLGPANQVVGG